MLIKNLEKKVHLLLTNYSCEDSNNTVSSAMFDYVLIFFPNFSDLNGLTALMMSQQRNDLHYLP